MWHAFADGVVVYVADTCETHLLPPSYAGLFDPSGAGSPDWNLSDADLQELQALKIFDLSS